MEQNERYMVFRVPTKKEQYRDGAIPHLWGWTVSKSVIRVFKQQRDQSKYAIVIMDDDEIAKEFSENELSDETMINYIELGDTVSGEMVPFFTTKVEMQEAEVRIQKEVSKMCSFDRLGGDPTPYVTLMMNLQEHYQGLLEFIGYCPKEMSDLFNIDPDYEIEEQIFGTYSAIDHYMIKDTGHQVPGSIGIDKLSNRIIYSLQSFVMVLKDDL